MVSLEEMARTIRENADKYYQIRGTPFVRGTPFAQKPMIFYETLPEVCVIGMLGDIYAPQVSKNVRQFLQSDQNFTGLEATEMLVDALVVAGLPMKEVFCWTTSNKEVLKEELWEILYRANDGLIHVYRHLSLGKDQMLTFTQIADVLEKDISLC